MLIDPCTEIDPDRASQSLLGSLLALTSERGSNIVPIRLASKFQYDTVVARTPAGDDHSPNRAVAREGRLSVEYHCSRCSLSATCCGAATRQSQAQS